MTVMGSSWRKIVPGENCYRAYLVRVEPDLFEPFRVCCQWGRIGGKKQQSVHVFGSLDEVTDYIGKVELTRLKHGYQQVDE